MSEETTTQKLFHRYFRDHAFKVSVDAFARDLGYRDALKVPKEDRDIFVEMFRESQRNNILGRL